MYTPQHALAAKRVLESYDSLASLNPWHPLLDHIQVIDIHGCFIYRPSFNERFGDERVAALENYAEALEKTATKIKEDQTIRIVL